VDLTPIVTPAYVRTTPAGTAAWHSILVGAERGGGQGLFALDVTDPTAFSEANAASLVLWEFTSATDADLGYTFSDPTIALMNNGRWAAIFGNGYNNGGSGRAELFIVYLDGGLDGTWTLGTDYLKIDTEAGDASNINGLSSPAVVDVDGNGTADRVYAGDLQGHVWAFDLSKSNDTQWAIAYKSGTTPEPLFTTATNQPITVKPEVAVNPQVTTTTGNSPNLLVLFGTGQYLVNGDKATTYQQAAYGVWDAGTSQLTGSNLVAQTVESGFPAGTRVLTNNTVTYSKSGASPVYGWYFNLPDSGERLVTDPVLRGDFLFYNTWIPSTDPCSYGGSSWPMVVDYVTGGRPKVAAFDYNNDGVIDPNDLLTSTDGTLAAVAPSAKKKSTLVNSPRFLSDYKYESDTGSRTPSRTHVTHLSGLNTGRLSWRELGR
jgi:type IV pilus assembly protein PilY1